MWDCKYSCSILERSLHVCYTLPLPLSIPLSLTAFCPLNPYIPQCQQNVRMIMDECDYADIYGFKRSGFNDMMMCEVTKQTPGDNRFIVIIFIY